MLWRILFVSWRTFDGPFSSVSRPQIARVGSFCSIFQNLHVVRAFAPQNPQIFCKFSSFFRDFLEQNLLFIAVKPIVWRIFWRNVDEFLTNSDEFLTNNDEFLTNSDEFWRILTNFSKKIRQKCVKKWRIIRQFVIFVDELPFVTTLATNTRGKRWRPSSAAAAACTVSSSLYDVAGVGNAGPTCPYF